MGELFRDFLDMVKEAMKLFIVDKLRKKKAYPIEIKPLGPVIVSHPRNGWYKANVSVVLRVKEFEDPIGVEKYSVACVDLVQLDLGNDDYSISMNESLFDYVGFGKPEALRGRPYSSLLSTKYELFFEYPKEDDPYLNSWLDGSIKTLLRGTLVISVANRKCLAELGEVKHG